MLTGEFSSCSELSKSVPDVRWACAAGKGVDPDPEQGGNINVMVRRDPAIRDSTRVLVHR
jgi:hypothetical protein